MHLSGGPTIPRVRRVILVALVALGVGCVGSGDDRCGERQVLQDEACVCAPGFALDGRTCVPVIEPADAGSVDAGTIDAGAVDSGEADAGVQVFLEQPCTGHDECGPDAPFCDTFYYDMCVISGCTVSPDDCPSGWECCDFTSFGLDEQICVYADACPTR